MSYDESMTAPMNLPPTVADEVDQRKAHVAILHAWFLAHPWQEIEAAELQDLVGRNYQQRISDLNLGVGCDALVIENVPKWFTPAVGRKRRLSGSYLYRPDPQLGRDASTPAAGASMPRIQTELFR